LFPAEIRVRRSLRKVLRNRPWRVSLDTAFEAVVAGCAAPRKGQEGTWITRSMAEAYLELHQAGYAHSVEVWSAQGALLGGLYGVAIGGVFFGESMFTRVSDASKVALVWLARQLQHWGFGLIDCQMVTAHLERMGARSLPRTEFLRLLRRYGALPHRPGPWAFDLPREALTGTPASGATRPDRGFPSCSAGANGVHSGAGRRSTRPPSRQTCRRHDRSMYAFQVTIPGPVAPAVERVKNALKEEGFGVLTEIDVQATLKDKLGVEMAPYLILGACNPPLAHQLIATDPDIGLLLPCNVLVREEEDGNVTVAFLDPVPLLALAENETVGEVARDAQARLMRVRDALAA
jgi:leucyl/phenylalanyl-tRNA--protein transferase